MYPLAIVLAVSLCLSDVIFLGAKELTLSIGLLCLNLFGLACYLEVLLLVRSLEESLIGVVLRPDHVTSMRLLRSNVSPSLLLVFPTVLYVTVLTDAACCTQIYAHVWP